MRYNHYLEAKIGSQSATMRLLISPTPLPLLLLLRQLFHKSYYEYKQHLKLQNHPTNHMLPCIDFTF
jgi:hypothetical protein